MNKVRWFLLGVVISICAFWVPDSAWHLVRKGAFDGGDVWLLTLALPMLTTGAYLFFIRRARMDAGERALLVGIITGIFVLGSAFIIGTLHYLPGTEPSRAGDNTIALILAALGPLSLTFLATYDGSLGALALAVIALLVTTNRKATN